MKRDGSDDGTGTQPEPPVEEAPTPEEQAEAALAEIDPQELAIAEARASLTTAYLVAQAESSGLDPSTLDTSALEDLMQQYLPQASASADAWLATLDPASLPLWQENVLCETDMGCASRIPCKYNAPPAGHYCLPTDCGKSKCSLCPDWVSDVLKSLVLKSWCAYVCLQFGPPKVVAIGAGGISAFNGYFVGPICAPP